MRPEFLTEDSISVAPKLLGWRLCRQTREGIISLKIVETEAYHQEDPASHSFRGLTPRTAPMFEAGGHIYVYFTYGMHYCLNIVTGPAGRGEGVLIRAGEPLVGIEIMKKNRYGKEQPASASSSADGPGGAIRKLCNGPGKLAQALGIFDTSLSGEMLNKSSIFLEPPTGQIRKKDIAMSPRIGIRHAIEQQWRFYLKDNPFVSRYTKIAKAR